MTSQRPLSPCPSSPPSDISFPIVRLLCAVVLAALVTCGACATGTAQQITLLAKGRKVTYAIAKLGAVNRLLSTIWRDLVGLPVSMPAGVIEYEIVTPPENPLLDP